MRPNKKLILEAKNSTYKFTKIYGYNSSDEVIQTLSSTDTDTVFLPESGVVYLRAEMKVSSSADYAPEKNGTPAAILKCLRIRENEQLEINAGCPLSGYRNANQMCKWFDYNGYGIEYNKYLYSDNDFKVGSVIFWGRTSSTSTYKNITHTSIYIGSGYVIHVSAPFGLVRGEAIFIQQMEQLMEHYTVPMAGISSPEYHNEEYY